MRFRALVAFVVGAALFAVVPYFDSEIPGQWERGELVVAAGLGVAAGSSPPWPPGMGSTLSSGTHQTRILLSAPRA